MTIPLKTRRLVHVLLFISILIIQILIYKIWFERKKAQNNLTESIQNVLNPNQSLIYSNLATKNYFDAGNHFNDYLQNHNKNSLNQYQNSLKVMAVYLDSLSILSQGDNDFSKIINAKQKTETEIIKLRGQLDSLMTIKIAYQPQKNYSDINVKKYDYTKILSSISYDTVKKTTEVKKKGLFGRIGNALKGKTEVNKEEVQSKIKMVFNNQEKVGSFKEQLENIFLFSEKYYGNEFSKLKNAYSDLKKKDNSLLQINKVIINKCQSILLFYSNSAQELVRLKYKNNLNQYSTKIENQKNSIFNLLMIMLLFTVLLLLYSIYSYIHEKNLEKAKKEAENNLDSKNQLIGMLSHEMRAPLTIISNFSGKLKTENTNSALNPIINSLHFTSNSLQITVNQILDFFKNENNKLAVYNSKINLKKEITSILDSLKSLSEVKGIEIISNIDNSLDNNVWADNVKIHQLFYNIIGNAIKFTKKGSITVNSKLVEIEENFRLDVKIKDTGSGIPEEDLKKIFNKFYQSKSHKEQMSFGAGLGLNLCKEIIELFNGEISVSSKLNEGTEISFFLIFQKPKVDQETFQAKLTNQFQNKKIKVAVVDDDIMILTILNKLFNAINFEFNKFESAAAIQTYLETEIVDLIITDINIFDYSGVELAKDIKNLNNKNSECPIIALTGDPYMSSLDLKNSGINEIIIKPINKEEFYQKIFKALQ